MNILLFVSKNQKAAQVDTAYFSWHKLFTKPISTHLYPSLRTLKKKLKKNWSVCRPDFSIRLEWKTSLDEDGRLTKCHQSHQISFIPLLSLHNLIALFDILP